MPVDQTTYTEDQMLAIGGTLLATRAYRRVYLNGWTQWIGLRTTPHGGQPILTASLEGRPFPPRRAGVLLADKVYWEDGRLHYEDVASHSKQFFGDDRLVVALLAGIAETVKEIGG